MSGPAAFRRVGIAGLGLIGGSIALATRRSLPETVIVGYDLSKDIQVDRIVDERRQGLAELADCDAVFVCAPIAAISRCFEELARTATSALITDVGSAKRRVMAAAAQCGLRSFVGGHPMAGSEQPGLGSARADLFDGRPWLLVRGSADEATGGRLEDFLRAIGARTQWMDAALHDQTVAYVSHLPQILAAALMNAAETAVKATGPTVAGNAFSEMTRLASSPSDMWATVLDDNADFVAEALETFLTQLPDSSRPAGEWVRDALRRSGEARDRWRQASKTDR